MGVSALMFSGAAAAVRHLSFEVHFIEIAFFRSVFGIVVMLPWLHSVGLGGLVTRHTRLYMTRAVNSAVAMFGWFGALALLPIADATSISFVTPLFISVAAVIFLSEPMRVARWIGLFVGFAGTLIILRPGYTAVNEGALMVLGSAVLIAWSAMIVKVVGRDDRPDTIALYQVLYMLPLTFVPALFVWTWPTIEQWFWLAMVGALSTFAQRAYTRAYAAADASAVMPFDFLRLPIAVALGFFWFVELPDLWTLIGGVVIFSSTFFVVRSEARADRNRPS